MNIDFLNYNFNNYIDNDILQVVDNINILEKSKHYLKHDEVLLRFYYNEIEQKITLEFCISLFKPYKILTFKIKRGYELKLHSFEFINQEIKIKKNHIEFISELNNLKCIHKIKHNYFVDSLYSNFPNYCKFYDDYLN